MYGLPLELQSSVYLQFENCLAGSRFQTSIYHKAMESHPDTQLIVFPELAVTGYQCGENFKDLAETATIDSTSIKKMSALAKEFHVHIVYGMAEKRRRYPL